MMNLPNIITIARAIMTIGVVCLLSAATGKIGEPFWILLSAELLFFVTAITDWLDGYIARKYNWESDFGRIADPFVDKITIVGALICLTALAGEFVRPWMVVLVAGREFLVTGIRSFVEAKGIKFGANFLGKTKLWIQATVVMIIIHGHVFYKNSKAWGWFTHLSVWIMVAFTTISAIPYIVAAYGKQNEPGT